MRNAPGQGGAHHSDEASKEQRSTVPPFPSYTPIRPPDYVIHDDRLCLVKHSKRGSTAVPLANFAAWITGDRWVEPEGQVYKRGQLVAARPGYRVYTVNGVLDTGDVLPTVRVKARDFASLAWIPERWGSRVIIYPGPAKAHVAAGIQALYGVEVGT
jgi:hypothetical protein